MEKEYNEKPMLVIDTQNMKWQEHYSKTAGKMMYKNLLVQDSETGMKVEKICYPKGFITKWHYHNCAHGIYVLEGILKTQQGCFRPGTFVWFPEKSLAEHGATAETDVVVLFITNKAFDIHYVEKV